MDIKLIALAISLFLALLSQSACMVDAFYSPSDNILELTSANFKSNILNKKGLIAVVEFYADYCGHCKSFAPEYKKAAAALHGSSIVVAAIDGAKNQDISAQYKISGFPTVKIFVDGVPTEYNGPRTAAGLVDAALAAFQKHVKSKLGGGSSSNQKSSSSSSSSKNSSGKKNTAQGEVVELSSSTFDSTVLSGSTEMTIVSFTAPWCGHCQRLKPEWKEAAKLLAGTGITIANVDATVHGDLASRFQVQGYPTIKAFPPGATKDSDAIEYQGPREAAGIAEWAQQTFERLGGQVQIDLQQLVSQSQFEDTCVKSKKCVIGFLPDLIDGGKNARNRYIEVLKEVAKSARFIKWTWVAAGEQSQLESKFNLGSGFPVAVMLRIGPNGEKVGYVHTGKFTSDSLLGFVNIAKSLSSGIQGNWPTITKTNPWNGEDAPEIKQEDDGFNLDEFLKEA